MSLVLLGLAELNLNENKKHTCPFLVWGLEEYMHREG
jgi:hypothetical protein